MIGWKVQIKGREEEGFCEIVSISSDGALARVRFYLSPVEYIEEVASMDLLDHRELPSQSRCSVEADTAQLLGRVLIAIKSTANQMRSYWIKLPNLERSVSSEDAFHIMSYRGRSNPLITLGSLAHETPFFATTRASLAAALVEQTGQCAGLTGLISAKIELFPHQVEIARRVLQDPVIRYLLADEVGLGKTIEAGIILNQLLIDAPTLRAAVFVPEMLKSQWDEDLQARFGLTDVRILAHEDLLNWKRVLAAEFGDEKHAKVGLDVLVIDEAHRIVANDNRGPSHPALFDAACSLAASTPHLLLLSATPILHRERELLALLHLLDPQMYRLENLNSFRAVLSLRQNIGRSLIALENVSLLSTTRNQVKRVAQLLPQDSIITELAANIERAAERNDRESVPAIVRQLRIHIGETYRIHRRMLRTRRGCMSETFSLGASRNAEAAEHELDDELFRTLWNELEDWRINAAAQSSLDSSQRKSLQEAYFDLANAMSSDLDRLQQLCIQRLTDAPESERKSLERIIDAIVGRDRANDRPELLVEVLRALHRRHGNSVKHVIFCSDPARCQSIAIAVENAFSAATVATVVESMQEDRIVTTENEEELKRFRDDPRCQVLIADRSLEEGHNLQFARGLILYDLPWAPMRLEQRIGRIDRIDRVEDVRVKVLLTLHESDLALDQAWYDLMVDAFGIFSASMADIQFLIETEMPRLRDLAFEGGPAALILEIPHMKSKVASERLLVAEQDVIDGLRMDELETTTLWRELEMAENSSLRLSDALCRYLKDNLQMWVTRLKDESKFRYGICDGKDPLVPADRILPLASSANQFFTHLRPKAVQGREIELLRVGHPMMETIQWLVNWDERGRAYALWRHATGVEEPVLIFRAAVLVSPDLTQVETTLRFLKYSELSRKALLRLVSGWFSGKFFERFVHDTGEPAEATWRQICQAGYNRDLDINLGGNRAAALAERFGGWNWPRLCREAGEVVRHEITVCSELTEAVHVSVESASQHFAKIIDRLRARSMANGIQPIECDAAIAEQAQLAKLVNQALSSPRVEIDSFGAYVLSDQPICPR